MIGSFALMSMGTLVIIYIIFSVSFYGKEKEYKQDERWSTIKFKAAQAGFTFYKILLAIIAFGVGWLLFESPTYNVSLLLILIIAFDLILIGQVLNLFAIKYYDKKM